jgi:hypothetical protein
MPEVNEVAGDRLLGGNRLPFPVARIRTSTASHRRSNASGPCAQRFPIFRTPDNGGGTFKFPLRNTDTFRDTGSYSSPVRSKGK